MNILDRYCAKEFTRHLMVAVTLFVSLYVIIELFGKTRMFLSNHATVVQIALFFAFSVPKILWQTLPIGVLMASLVTFGSFSRRNEIVAMKSCGISLYRIAVPIVAIAAVAGMVTFLIGEYLAPYTNRHAERIKLVHILKQEMPGSFKRNQIWYRSRTGIYNVKVFDPQTNSLQGVTLYSLDGNLNLTERMDADKGEWKNGKWIFYDVVTTTFPQDGFPLLQARAQKIVDLPEVPEDFKTIQKNAETMGYWELRQYIEEIQSDGYDATSYRVDMHAKLAFPFVTIIMAIIGMAASIHWERKGGMTQGVATGIAIGFSYWIVFAFAVSLGHAGGIPPLLSAWTANIIFGFTSVFLLLRVRT